MSPKFLIMCQFPYVFVWVLLKADPETRMWVPTVDFGGDLTKHGKGGLKWPRKGTRADKVHVNKQQPFGAGGVQCHSTACPSEPLFSNPVRLGPRLLLRHCPTGRASTFQQPEGTLRHRHNTRSHWCVPSCLQWIFRADHMGRYWQCQLPPPFVTCVFFVEVIGSSFYPVSDKSFWHWRSYLPLSFIMSLLLTLDPLW